MARTTGRSGFKMKSSPTKGKLGDFFSSLGNQLRRNRKDIGGEFKGIKQKDKPRRSAAELNKSTDKEINITTKRSVDPAASTKNSKITVPEVKTKLTFKKAFAAARKANKKTFSWSGKSYTTELAKTKKKKTTTTPKVKKSSSNDINQDGIDDDIQGLTKNR